MRGVEDLVQKHCLHPIDVLVAVYLDQLLLFLIEIEQADGVLEENVQASLNRCTQVV
jgi:hypothetical protein